MSRGYHAGTGRSQPILLPSQNDAAAANDPCGSGEVEIGQMETGCLHIAQNNLELRISGIPVRVTQDHGIGSNLRPVQAMGSQRAGTACIGRESEAVNVNMIEPWLEIVDCVETRGR